LEIPPPKLDLSVLDPKIDEEPPEPNSNNGDSNRK